VADQKRQWSGHRGISAHNSGSGPNRNRKSEPLVETKVYITPRLLADVGELSPQLLDSTKITGQTVPSVFENLKVVRSWC
jgi:hypothetical protein